MARPTKFTPAGNDQNWMTALQAVQYLSPRIGSDIGAKAAIFERLKDCSIQARAAWFAMGIDVGVPYVEPRVKVTWREGDQPPTTDNTFWLRRRQLEAKPEISADRYGDGLAISVWESLSLGGAFWSAVTEDDLKRWKWYEGFCIATQGSVGRSDGETMRTTNFPFRMFALGVEFARADISRIAPDVAHVGLQVGSRGRPLAPQAGDWFAELLLLHDAEGIENWTANRLVETLRDTMAEKGLPEVRHETAWKIAEKVLRALRTASAAAAQ